MFFRVYDPAPNFVCTHLPPPLPGAGLFSVARGRNTTLTLSNSSLAMAYYFRTNFTVSDAGCYFNLSVNIFYGDGAVSGDGEGQGVQERLLSVWLG